jgi:hypothetical protein
VSGRSVHIPPPAGPSQATLRQTGEGGKAGRDGGPVAFQLDHSDGYIVSMLKNEVRD